jgi:hypothetical protein
MGKKIIIIVLTMIITVGKTFAQNDGIYRMVQLKSEKAKKWIPYPWIGRNAQYKMCLTENDQKVLIHFTIYGNMNNDNIHFTVFRDLPVTSNNNPKALQEVCIFDVTENAFKEKWFSNYTNHNYFVQNAWMIEQWEKADLNNSLDYENIMPMVRLFREYKNGEFKYNSKNSYGVNGMWERKGSMCENDSVKTFSWGPDERQQNYFKIYLDDKMMTLLSHKGKFLETREDNIEGWYGKVERLSDNLIFEWNNKNPVIIKWDGKDMMHNIFVDKDGKTVHEVWERLK